jgi:hypothetical protein
VLAPQVQANGVETGGGISFILARPVKTKSQTILTALLVLIRTLSCSTNGLLKKQAGIEKG